MSLGARRIGFIASALLHAGVAGIIVLPGPAPIGSVPSERRVPLSLDMFPSPRVPEGPAPVQSEPVAAPQTVVRGAPPLRDAGPEPAPVTPGARPAEDNGRSRTPAREVPTMPQRMVAGRPQRKPLAPTTPPRRPGAPPVARAPSAGSERQTEDAASAAAPSPPPRRDETALHETAAGQFSRLRQAYLDELLGAIRRHRYYPRKARRRSEQGTVVVGFVIEADGGLSEIGVRRTSGSRRLDEAALQTLHKLTPFRPIPPALDRDRWPITVPIEFRLR